MILAGFLAVAIANTALAPSGKWTVDYRPDMCLASRPFGTGDVPLLFGFESAIAMQAGGATLLLVAPDARGGGVRRGSATIRLEPSGRKVTLDYLSWVTKGNLQRGYEISVGGDFMTELSRSTAMSITVGKDSFALAMGKVQPVLDAMKTCNDNLMRSWGVDPKAQAEPVGNPGRWFVADDYPAGAKSRGAQGRVTVMVTVNPAGRVDACRVVASSNDPDLDSTTCDVVRKHGRFSPKGNPSFATYSIRWSL